MILANKVVLVRNFKDYVFPDKMSMEEKLDVCNKVKAVFKKSVKYSQKDITKNRDYYRLKNLLSLDFLASPEGRMLYATEDFQTRIMVNYKEHLRVEIFSKSDKVASSLKEAVNITKRVDEKLPLAFDPSIGFLTTTLEGLGLGMQISYIVHIPLLELSAQLDVLKGTLHLLDCGIKPYMADEGKSVGGFYEVFTNVCNGNTESQVFSKIRALVLKIEEKEASLRRAILEKENLRIDDEVNRAYGILTNAKIIKHKESEVLLSYLKLGIDLNLYDDKKLKLLEGLDLIEILDEIRDEALCVKNGVSASDASRLMLDKMRMDRIKEILL